VTNLKYWIVVFVAVLAGIGLLYISGIKWFKAHATLGTLSNQLGGLLIASVALATIWDLVGRRALLQEVLDIVRLKDDIVISGLDSAGTDYNRAVDWDSHLSKATHLDIFAAWATTWRNTHQGKLAELAARSGARIRVCLPNPEDDTCVQILAARFNRTPQDVRTKLNEAIDDYRRLDNNSHSGRVEIYTSSVYRAFSAYRIDDVFVVTLYHHKDSRSASVPALSCRKGGTLFAFFEDDLEGVLTAHAAKIYP
jgi:hypothetical protein